MADQHRAAECVKSPGVGQQLKIVFGRLAEADARIQRDAILLDAGGQQGVAAGAKVFEHFGDDVGVDRIVLHGAGRAAACA